MSESQQSTRSAYIKLSLFVFYLLSLGQPVSVCMLSGSVIKQA